MSFYQIEITVINLMNKTVFVLCCLIISGHALGPLSCAACIACAIPIIATVGAMCAVPCGLFPFGLPLCIGCIGVAGGTGGAACVVTCSSCFVSPL